MTTSFSAPEHKAPEATLETAFIEEFFRGRALASDTIRSRTDTMAISLWREAVQYAALKLAEIEARSHYVHDIHGVEP